MKLLNHPLLVPFFALLAAVVLMSALLLSIVLALMRQTKQREKLHNQQHPQASKPLSKIIPYNTIKN